MPRELTDFYNLLVRRATEQAHSDLERRLAAIERELVRA